MNSNNNQLPTVTIGSTELNFLTNTGIVDKVSKRVETHLSSSSTATNRSHTVSVQSSNTTVTELWMKDGDRELDHTLRVDLSVKEGQRISVLSVAGKSGKYFYVGVVNHNTGTYQAINPTDKLIDLTNTVPHLSGILCLILIFASWAVGASMESAPLAVILSIGLIAWWGWGISKRSQGTKMLNQHIQEIKSQIN